MRCGPNLTPEREAVICGGTAETSGFGITMSQANPVFWVGGQSSASLTRDPPGSHMSVCNSTESNSTEQHGSSWSAFTAQSRIPGLATRRSARVRNLGDILMAIS
jgi:hypothetical protein